MFNPSILSPSHQGTQRTVDFNEFDGILRHLNDCEKANGAWHSLRCKAEFADAFLSGRVVSMVTVAGGVLALCVLW